MRWSLVSGLFFFATSLLISSTAGSLIVLDSVFSDNGRLAAAPKFPCVGGVVTPFRTSPPFDQNVAEVEISIPYLNLHASTSVRVKKGGPWRACFPQQIEVSSFDDRYTLLVKGVSNSGTVLESHTVSNVSFGSGIVLDGQSNMMFPSSLLLGTDIVLTNFTKIMEIWSQHNYYGITLMMTPGQTNPPIALEPTNVFPTLAHNWTRFDHPNFRRVALEFGWLSLTRCIEHAKVFGPTHCVQIAFASTRLAAHMSILSHGQSGATEPKPFTTTGTEALQRVGGFWNGAKVPITNWDPDWWDFYQGEADWATSFEYPLLLAQWIHDVRRVWRRTKIVIYGLAPFGGHSSQPLFNLTTQAQRFVNNVPAWDKYVCFVATDDLGYWTIRDGGLHPIDTKYDAAIRATTCAENLDRSTKHLVHGPKVLAPGLLVHWNASDGATTVRLQFETGKPMGSNVFTNVHWGDVRRSSVPNVPVFYYDQWLPPTFSKGSVMNPTVVANGQTVEISFFTERPAFGPPTTFVYGRYGGGFPKSLLMNSPSSVTPKPDWSPAPWPAQPFSVPLVVAF